MYQAFAHPYLNIIYTLIITKSLGKVMYASTLSTQEAKAVVLHEFKTSK